MTTLRTPPQSLASFLDHTKLALDTTPADVRQLCEEANQYGFAAVCIRPEPELMAVAKETLKPSVKLAVVIGFPSEKRSCADETQQPTIGTVPLEKQLAEIQEALSYGAAELDVVFPVSLLPDFSTNLANIKAHLVALRQAAPKQVLKVIIETDLLPDEQIEQAVYLCVGTHMNCVKTSTGMITDPEPLEQKAQKVLLIQNTLDKLGASSVFIKVSGGIRSINDIQQFSDFSRVTRLGTSSACQLIE